MSKIEYKYNTIEELRRTIEYHEAIQAIEGYYYGKYTMNEVYEKVDIYLNEVMHCKELYLYNNSNDYFSSFANVKDIPFGDKK